MRGIAPKAACQDAEGIRKVSAVERALAWLLTGPVGRVVAFVGDLAAALGGWALRRIGLRSDPE